MAQHSLALSIDFVANKLQISTRYLHMLFKPQQVSISKYILQQRVEACAKALAHPEYQHYSTTDIAMEWCFADASHFNRCFKAH
ncbi:MAG: helix-turn-helix domain-containing protein [Cellvibrionaceae bacterium]|nr:helix-turn-helix domain-containing protein [Cellvibrionaceae bacterium]